VPLVASQSVLPNELQVACHPNVPAMRGNIRAVTCEPVFRPQPQVF